MNQDIEILTRMAALAYGTGNMGRGDMIVCLQAGERMAAAFQSLAGRVKELEEKYEPKAAEQPIDQKPEPGNGEPAN